MKKLCVLLVTDLPNHFLFGSTLADVPEESLAWKGAAFTICPRLFLCDYRNKIKILIT